MALKARCSAAEDRLETMVALEAEVKTLRERHAEWVIEREDRDHRIRDLHLKLSIAEKKATETEAEEQQRQEEMFSQLEKAKKVDQTLAMNDTQWQAKLAKAETRPRLRRCCHHHKPQP